jgi:hypothetical protein
MLWRSTLEKYLLNGRCCTSRAALLFALSFEDEGETCVYCLSGAQIQVVLGRLV